MCSFFGFAFSRDDLGLSLSLGFYSEVMRDVCGAQNRKNKFAQFVHVAGDNGGDLVQKTTRISRIGRRVLLLIITLIVALARQFRNVGEFFLSLHIQLCDVVFAQDDRLSRCLALGTEANFLLRGWMGTAAALDDPRVRFLQRLQQNIKWCTSKCVHRVRID